MAIIDDLNSDVSILLEDFGEMTEIRTGTMDVSSQFRAIVDADTISAGVSEYQGSYQKIGELLLDPATGAGWIDPVSGEEITIAGRSYVVEDSVNDNGIVYVKYVRTRS